MGQLRRQATFPQGFPEADSQSAILARHVLRVDGARDVDMSYSIVVQIDTPDPEDVLVQPLWELTLLALEEGLDLHRFGKEPPGSLPGTLAMTALDVTLAMLVRHPVWTHRLADLHGVVLEGKGVEGAKLDALVQRFPLEG